MLRAKSPIMVLSNTLFVALTAVPLVFSAAVADRRQSSAPVCIVGGGPSGLTAASALEAKGREVVVFEKRPDVGGKCQSVYDEDGNYYPLGAVLLTSTPGYAKTFSLVQRLGVDFQVTERDEEWTYDPETGSVELTVRTPEQTAQILAELVRYTALWTALAPTFLVPDYQNGVPEELAVSGRDWLLANNLTALAAVVNRAWGDFGYGPFTTVPALYYLRSAVPDVLAALLTTGTLTTDFHEVFTRFSETIEGPIHLSSEIQSIDRSEDSPKITYRKAGSSQSSTQLCSDVIIAFPPTPSALSDANLELSTAEEELFSNVITNTYFSSAVEIGNMSPDVSLRREIPGPVTPYAPQGEPVYAVRIHDNTNIFSVWSMDQRDQPDSAQVAQELLPTVLSEVNRDIRDPESEAEPVTNNDVLGFSGLTDYFPHIETEALLSGWYDQFNELQGNLHTYYVSGLNQFEFVEYALRSAEALVDAHF